MGLLKDTETTRTAASSSVPAVALAGTEESEAPGQASPCPACGSPACTSVLTARVHASSRTLVSCSRCGLLRFLEEAPKPAGSRFSEFILRQTTARNLAEQALHLLKRRAVGSLLRFAATRTRAQQAPELLLHLDAMDGWFCRQWEQGHTDCMVSTQNVPDASRAFHRDGIFAVVAESAEPPLRMGTVDAVVRLRGFSSELDPAGWLAHIVRRIRPGGRVVLQVFDCSSWGFLVCGSGWVGLEADSATFAYRADDLEVLLELCGMRVVRRSHFFPWMNALVWASSLFPGLDPSVSGDTSGGPPASSTLLLYVLAAVALLPLAVVESLCDTGSTLMLEAERKA